MPEAGTVPDNLDPMAHLPSLMERLEFTLFLKQVSLVRKLIT